MKDPKDSALWDAQQRIADRLLKDEGRVQVSMHIPVVEDHKEGDVWEDTDGRTWTIKNGSKESVSHMQEARMPWWCPKCQQIMNKTLDDKMWRLHGMCFDCVVKLENQIRVEGKWDAYEKKKIYANYIAWTKERIEEIENYKRLLDSNPEFVYQDGRREEFTLDAAAKDNLVKACQDSLEFFHERLLTFETIYEQIDIT